VHVGSTEVHEDHQAIPLLRLADPKWDALDDVQSESNHDAIPTVRIDGDPYAIQLGFDINYDIGPHSGHAEPSSLVVGFYVNSKLDLALHLTSTPSVCGWKVNSSHYTDKSASWGLKGATLYSDIPGCEDLLNWEF
jgi:hypothetical protein